MHPSWGADSSVVGSLPAEKTTTTSSLTLLTASLRSGTNAFTGPVLSFGFIGLNALRNLARMSAVSGAPLLTLTTRIPNLPAATIEATIPDSSPLARCGMILGTPISGIQVPDRSVTRC